MVSVMTRSVALTACFVVLLCGIYPLLITGIGKVLFPSKVNGGIIEIQGGRIVGSRIIGQSFTKPEYFHGRPSAAGSGYDASNSSGTNLGPTSQKLIDGIKSNVDAALKENPSLTKGSIPVDMVTASASGLDPHISPENAYAQVDRVAKARNASVEQVKDLVREHIEGPQLGLFGEAGVNVLLLNLDLDRVIAKK